MTQAAYLTGGIALAHPFVDGNKRIALAHPFVDGNKRIAMLAGEAFLRLNGMRYSGDALDLARQVEALTTVPDRHETGIARLAEWLRPHLREAR